MGYLKPLLKIKRIIILKLTNCTGFMRKKLNHNKIKTHSKPIKKTKITNLKTLTLMKIEQPSNKRKKALNPKCNKLSK